MLNIVHRPLARIDIKAIWRYTHNKWGLNQADLYVQELGQAINNLANVPMSGVAIEQVHQGCRLFHFRRHLVIYTVSDNNLILQRVLHQRMDIARHSVQ